MAENNFDKLIKTQQEVQNLQNSIKNKMERLAELNNDIENAYSVIHQIEMPYEMARMTGKPKQMPNDEKQYLNNIRSAIDEAEEEAKELKKNIEPVKKQIRTYNKLIKQLEKQINLENKKLDAEIKKTKAQGDADAKKISAEGSVEAKKIKAEGDVDASKIKTDSKIENMQRIAEEKQSLKALYDNKNKSRLIQLAKAVNPKMSMRQYAQMEDMIASMDDETVKKNLTKLYNVQEKQMNPTNKQWLGDLKNNFNSFNLKGLKETFKNVPEQLKIFGSFFVAGVKLFEKAINKFDETVNSYRNIASKRSATDSESIYTKSLNSTIGALDLLKKSITNVKDGFESLYLFTSEKLGKLGLNGFFGNLIGVSTTLHDIRTAGENFVGWLADVTGSDKLKSLYSKITSNYSIKEQDNIKADIMATAKTSGADKATADTMSGRATDLISRIQSEHNLDKTAVEDGVKKLIFSGDTSGLQALGINDYNLKAGLYEQGFDVSGNTKYMNSALAGGRLSALEKLVGLTDLQLQEMTQQGLVLDSINQNFAWESVEAISTVNTDAGHYNSNGDFIVSDNISQGLEDVSQSLDNTSDKISNFFSASHGGKVAGYKTLAETSGTILGQRILSENYDYSSFPSLMIDKNSGLFNKSSQSNIKVDVAVESNDEKLKAYVKNIVQDENYKSANQSFSPTNSGNPNFKHRIDGLSFK